MRRREFIAGLGGAITLPVIARAQQSQPRRRIGVLIEFDERDREAQTYFSGFIRRLEELGWVDGRTARIDVRWAASDVGRIEKFAKELVDLRPDVILASSTPVTAAIHLATLTIPVTFVMVADPIGPGFVANLAHPGGNLTGFSNAEPEMASRWLALLSEIAPGTNRAAFMFNPDTAPGRGSYYRAVFEATAHALKIEPIFSPVYSDAEVEAIMTSLARKPGAGFVVDTDAFIFVHRRAIMAAAARNNLPGVYPYSVCPREGGLLSYGADIGDIWRRGATYVDRILRGEKVADLPVQLPTKFQTALNMKTAKALGLAVPESILLRAEEVIE